MNYKIIKSAAARLLQLFVLLAALATPAWAIDLPAYRDKIRQARESADLLLSGDADAGKQDRLSFERETTNKIRRLLSATEKVELKGETFEADHGSVLQKLAEFESADAPGRSRIADEISVRLTVLEAKLTEVERQQAGDRAKDQDKQKLDEILRRADYQKPEQKGESVFQRMSRKIFDWLARFFPRPNINAPSPESAKSLSLAVQIIVLAAVLGIIGFLLYRFAPFLMQRFGRREKSIRKERVILGETLAEDETSENLFAEAERLAREGNLRGAVRKGYVALLCELADRKIIGLNKHKTNRDYLRDVRKRAELHRNMKTLTGDFERIWYGFGETGQDDWEAFRRAYKETLGAPR